MNEQAKLIAIAKQIRDWQLSRQMTDVAITGEYDIGSAKTYRKLADGNAEGYDAARWLPKYQAAWNLINAAGSKQATNQVYDDVMPAVRLRAAFGDAMQETGNDRLIIVEGGPGAGKTSAVLALKERFGSRIIITEAAETWRESINAMLADMLKATGVKTLPVSAAAKLDTLIDKLCERRQCLVVDEAHHLGPRGLNTIKTIINKTPGEVIMMGLPVLLKRLEIAAYQEARQLTLNRLCERITLAKPDGEDVALLLSRIIGISLKEARAAAPAVAAMAATRGDLKFVSRVAKRCQRDDILTADDINKMASRIAAGR
jgi:DNA transposition AAA+ family ATPase